MFYARILHPTVLWAQRKSVILLTIELSDVESQIDLSESKIEFRAGKYAFELEFYDKVETEYKRSPNRHQIELTIVKQQEGYWPKLVKEKKPAFLKTDFKNWMEEEDEDGEVDEQMDFSQFGLSEALSE